MDLVILQSDSPDIIIASETNENIAFSRSNNSPWLCTETYSLSFFCEKHSIALSDNLFQMDSRSMQFSVPSLLLNFLVKYLKC